jgi:hypothetical protein
MPTARELLEQADALMRRNRDARAAANEPVKPPAMNAPSIAPSLASPRPIQHEPIAPSVARTSLPVDPTESPLVGARDVASEEVPVLTDAVVDDTPVDAQRDLDDVPVLTDVVEEIEMTVAPLAAEGGDEPFVDESARGEPSFWSDEDRGETSVLGPAPDSVIAVPPLEGASPVPVPPLGPEPGRDPLGFDQPAPGFDAVREERAFESAPEPVEAFEEPVAEARIEPDASQIEEFVAEPAMQRVDGQVDEPVAEGRMEPAVGTAETRSFAPVADRSVPPVESFASLPAASAQPSGAAVVRTSSEQDEARVRAIAEEIGMQVLQRIDIFTDTTLRERLGERLQPVVERVSAELVDALNQHVGELLRAHVAEAIEREIETWRSRGSGE